MAFALARRLAHLSFLLALTVPVARLAEAGTAGPAAARGESGAVEGSDLAARLAAIEATIERERRQRHVPGAALVIVKDGRVLTMRGFGFRNLERRLPVTPDTLFPIGSCTKSFTAMTVMISVDDGKLSLTDSPKRYLPYFRLRDPEADRKITLADILCHRTGLGRGGDLAWFTGVPRPEAVIRVAGRAQPAARFRVEFAYSNTMYLAAGEVVAKVQRMSCTRVVERRIFRPLGMKSANISLAAMQRDPDHALGYTYDEETGQTTLMPARDLWNIAPAGAIYASARDMAQFLRLMLDGRVHDGRRLLSQESFAALITPHVQVMPNLQYGYGWRLGKWNGDPGPQTRGHRLVEHGGSTDGFDAVVAFMPEQKLGVALLTNLHYSSLRWVALEAVWKHLAGVPEPAAAPAESASAAPPRQKSRTRTSRPCRAIALLRRRSILPPPNPRAVCDVAAISGQFPLPGLVAG